MAVFYLSELISSAGQMLSKELYIVKANQMCGIVIIRAEAVKESNHLCLYRAYGRNLKLRSGALSSFTSWFSFKVRYEI
jgi:hypothetical protein